MFCGNLSGEDLLERERERKRKSNIQKFFCREHEQKNTGQIHALIRSKATERTCYN